MHGSDVYSVVHKSAVLSDGIASCSASDFAYCYQFLRSVVFRLSVVCHIRAPCLNRSTDLDAIW